jgi:hypothetical protein
MVLDNIEGHNKRLDTVVEENFMGDTTNSLRKDTLGMIEYLEEVYRKK